MGEPEDDAEEKLLDAEAVAAAEKLEEAKAKKLKLANERAEKARLKAQEAELKARMAAGSTSDAEPASTSASAPRVVDVEIMDQRMTLFQEKMLTSLEQFKRDTINEVRGAVQQGAKDGVVEAFRSKEGCEAVDKIADRMGDTIAKKMPNPPYKRMLAGIMVAMLLLCVGAFMVLKDMQRKNQLANSAGLTQQLSGLKDVVKTFGEMIKKMPKTQIVMAPTVTSSDVVNSEKVRSVVVVNYSAKPLKVYEIKIGAEGQTSKFVSLVPAGFARQLSYEGGAVKLVVAGEDFKTQPEDFTGGMWVWRFDNDANKGGMRTQDTALLPK